MKLLPSFDMFNLTNVNKIFGILAPWIARIRPDAHVLTVACWCPVDEDAAALTWALWESGDRGCFYLNQLANVRR